MHACKEYASTLRCKSDAASVLPNELQPDAARHASRRVTADREDQLPVLCCCRLLVGGRPATTHHASMCVLRQRLLAPLLLVQLAIDNVLAHAVTLRSDAGALSQYHEGGRLLYC